MVSLNDWKSVILGVIIALILSLFLAKVIIGGLFAGIMGFLIAGLIVGYLESSETEHVSIIGHLTNSGTENAAINGAAAGFVGGIVFVLIGVVMTSFMYNAGSNTDMFIMGGIPVAIMAGVVFGIISAVGGAIGVHIKSKT